MRVLFSQPWPWYVTGPLMGAVALALLVLDGRVLGVSASYRTLCAAVAPGRVAFFRFDWRSVGGWNLAFACGIALGGWVGVHLLGSAEPVRLSAAARADLAALGITDFTGLVPRELFSWRWALSPRGLVSLGLGGVLAGFGASWAGGCTTGHGISGLADLQLPSLVAVIGFFVGGFLAVHLLLPLVLRA
jgi:uncharacterized membrane protein YedE/YeeE